MASVKSVDFLPEIFQTPTNKQFLSATLDQLIQEPNFSKVQGFIGGRIGPGVNANDFYVVEPTATRTNYQLEPAVVITAGDSDTAVDAITYPGILDTLNLQGSPTEKASPLFSSEYYTWDPMIDYDKFVNFAEYYWVPTGTDPVPVFGSALPIVADIDVTRNIGNYTFDLVDGTNPTLTLIRGGEYRFRITQNSTTTTSLRVTNRGSNAYIIDYLPNPDLTLIRGNTYEFDLSLGAPLPFYIKTQPTTGTTNQYNNGVTNNGAIEGTIVFTVPYEAPDKLFYICEVQSSMQGVFNIVDPQSGSGPKFFIQAAPGIQGTMPGLPNISSREVLGVQNNGTDLGFLTFTVPTKTAQNFYYTLDSIDDVDLATTMAFDKINGAYVDDFLATYGGIDGVADIENKTLVFLQNPPIRDEEDAIEYGWIDVTGYSPNFDPSVIEDGDYDFPNFNTSVPLIQKSQRFVVWQINFLQDVAGDTFIKLTTLSQVNVYQKFTIRSGNEYSSVQYYKNEEEIFERIPLLTAVLDTLYYQDGQDPSQYGEIRLIEPGDNGTLYIEDIIGKPNFTSPNSVVFTNGLNVEFFGNIEPPTYKQGSYYVEGVGTGIKLIPTSDFVTPELYAGTVPAPFDFFPFDSTNYEVQGNSPIAQDYLTINRASLDKNAWSRYNRWFHRNVIIATSEYNNQPAILDQVYRAKRPIIEFRAGLRLQKFGTKGIGPIDVIDYNTVDAFSQVVGQTQYNIDGYQLLEGSKVIFAADTDVLVRNKVYTVSFVIPDTQPPLIPQPIITLTETVVPTVDDTTVCLNGVTLQGTSLYFDGESWQRAQVKNGLNQAPLFDVYDADEVSFSDHVRYPSSTFTGSKIFGYAQGTGPDDPVLKFPLKYLTISNVGDIVFDNFFYDDTFIYVVNRTSITEMVSKGFVREYTSQDTYVNRLGWQPARSASQQYQQFRFIYDGSDLQLDIRVLDLVDIPGQPTQFPVLKVYVGSKFIQPNEYSYSVTDNTTVIRLNQIALIGDNIEVLALSNQVSTVGFYQIPINLEFNPFNENSPEFTLGTIRGNYETICENLTSLQGPINGANNSRDLGNIIPYGTNIVQQSSPLSLASYFLRNQSYGVFESIYYNSQEYIKFKNKLMDAVASNYYNTDKPGEILTEVMSQITRGLNSTSPFYWSDMLPAGSIFETTVYNYTVISTPVFDTQQVYNYTSSNYKGLNVYINDRLLTRGYDYVTNPDTASLTITAPLVPGDTVTVQEFTSTLGNFVPNTPTKVGLYPAFRPRIYVDNSYQTPTTVIEGHDGSKTRAFGDIRDQILLEFETRIFNNLKVVTAPPIEVADVVPGQFRITDFSSTDIQNILNQDFLSYVGWNKLDYQTQDYQAKDPFSWNYSQAANRLTGKPLLGAWRGIYLSAYDTVTPNLTPWEMLGFSQEPDWWQDRYGPAPYTSGNLVLWDDLEAGRIAEPGNDRIDLNFARPGLKQIIPAGPQGELLPPIESIVGAYDPLGFKGAWQPGDYGPVEYSWRASSAYPFALMRLYALLRPAQFFALNADRDLYVYDSTLKQYLYDKRYRLNTKTLEIYGNAAGKSKASYINWIVDYNTYVGNLQSTESLRLGLANLDIRLAYRLAGFSNKQYIQLLLEKPSPNSVNTSLLLPDDSYDLLLYKNQPFEDINYSSIMVQIVPNGYAVYGYGITKPYFPVLVSRPIGVLQTITAGGVSTQVPSVYTDQVVNIPYGTIFNNIATVVDFILSYGKLLERQGMSFTDMENGYILDWNQMAAEFMYWSQQGWQDGSVINLNPSAVSLSITKPLAIVDDLSQLNTNNQPKDQNGNILTTNNLVIERLENTFKMTSQNEQTISFAHLRFINYEHVIVLKNTSLFGDLLYSPVTGARQIRIKFAGFKTNDWNGQLNAQGFVLNQDNILDWKQNVRYTKGQVVKYKNQLYVARTIVQPSTTFDNNDWLASDYNLIQKGLLPNLPNKSNQLANSYDINNANLNVDSDLLSYGLTGFRPRRYMSSLDLDDVSQVNVYRQFIGDKGTIAAIRLLTNANFGKEAAEYQIYENWGILNGVYGAQDNSRYIDLRLNAANLTNNSSIVEVVDINEISSADQSIVINQIFASSYFITSKNFLPTRDFVITPKSLPWAGYVNIDDIDVAVFDLNNPQNLNPYFDSLQVGSKIWVAAVNQFEWSVYRCSKVEAEIITAQNNIDGTWIMICNEQHGLLPGEIVVIKQFNDQIDGTYRIFSVPDLYTFSVQLALENQDTATTFNGTGLMLKLLTMRVAQPSNAVNLSYINELTTGSSIWVDDNGQGQWQVLTKVNQFKESSTIIPTVVEPNTDFGISVGQRQDHLAVLVGRPDFPQDRGTVINYLEQLATEDYIPGSTLNLENVVGLGNYGASVSVGANSFAAAGAPTSANNVGYAAVLAWQLGIRPSFYESQILLANDQPGPGQFGKSLAMSQDERWLYVGAPQVNAVYVYGRQDIETQSVSYTAGQNQNFYSVSSLQFDFDTQLAVYVNEEPQIFTSQWYLDNTNIVFYTAPEPQSIVRIDRQQTTLLDSEWFLNLVATQTTGFGVGAIFDIQIVRGQFRPRLKFAGRTYSVGEVITYKGTIFGGKSPANDCRITVTDVSFIGEILAISVSGSFVPSGGLPYQFPIDQYLFGITGIDSITVRVNGVMQRPKLDYELVNADSSTPDSAAADNYLLVMVSIPGFGADIVVTGGTHFVYSSKIVSPEAGAIQFGSALAIDRDGRTLIVGAPNQQQGNYLEVGASYIYSRNVEKFVVTNSSQNTFTTVAPLLEPTVVKLNGEVLRNSAFYFPADYTAGVNTVSIATTLSVGDLIEVETNQMLLVQSLSPDTAITSKASILEKIHYGQSVGMCMTGCSAYIGVPDFSDYDATQSGLVARLANQSKLYGMIASTQTSPGLTASGKIRINNVVVTVPDAPNNTVAGLVSVINTGIVPNVTAQDASGKLVIMVINQNSATPGNKLSVLPVVGSNVFTQLGFNTFVQVQTLQSPYPVDEANFGASLAVSNRLTTIAVGAPKGTAVVPTTFDDGLTYFDFRSTTYSSYVNNSGVVYEFDYLPSANESILNPGKFVFGQQIYNSQNSSNDLFGTSINLIDSYMLVGAPGLDYYDSTANEGMVVVFKNPTLLPAWAVTSQETPVVDIDLINTASMYDPLISSMNVFLDFFDPLQGKVLSVCQRNLDYIGAVDPASYNNGTNNVLGNSWYSEKVGQVWWNTSTVRFIDPRAGDLQYENKRWGQVFPGSVINIYQWIQSTEPPASYTGEGTVFSTTDYSSVVVVGNTGVLVTYYYFWVKDITTVYSNAGKTLSVYTIARYLEDPVSSGIPYMIPLKANAVGLVNCKDFISAADTILHIGFDQRKNDDVVHYEYQLIADGRENSRLNDNLYNKLVDSLCGINITGKPVPDPTLAPAMRYGVLNRPRQSMFINRYLALNNLVEFSNNVMSQFTLAELNLSFSLLNAKEPEPSATSGDYNLRVENLEQLSWQNINIVPLGYRYLVAYDANNDGLWTIYQVQLDYQNIRTLVLKQVQSFDTTKYWNYTNWYATDYNPTTPVQYEVAIYGDLSTIPRPFIGETARVNSNSQGKWEIYRFTLQQTWERVAVQGGTIAIDPTIYDYSLGRWGFDSEVFDAQYFDDNPETETRYIVNALYKEIFIDEFLIYQNQLTILLFNFILSEQPSPEWLMKTSLIDVQHKIRQLIPYPTYRRDNQDFVLQYIQEVKPYHVQIKQFDLQYSGEDFFTGDVTDFDLPAKFFTNLVPPSFQSPILSINNAFANSPAAAPPDAEVWQEFPYNQWYTNYLLELDIIEIANAGSGYTSAPTVKIVGLATRLGTATAQIDSLGRVVSVTITDPGEGYYYTPAIEISGGNGTGAQAVPRMINDLVRTFNTTIKFDRTEYNQTFVPWEPNVTYDNGTLVSYADRIWRANSPDSTGVDTAEFNLEDWIEVPIELLSGVDRTMGYYVPGINQPGKELPLLITGVDYPGVQVQNVPYSANTGFDRSPYDTYVFDNYQISPEGVPTYSDQILDVILESQYLDSFLGTRPADIITDGGAYIDTYSSHAPEELVPGSEFDTLDFRVYTRPGADWTGLGHGFAIESVRYEFDSTDPILSFAGLLRFPVTVQVTNVTTFYDLNLGLDYTVDWDTQTVEINNNASVGDTIMIRVFELGGGNQLHRGLYTGAEANAGLIIPVAFNEIQDFVVFVNGQYVPMVNNDLTINYSYSLLTLNTTRLTFDLLLADNDFLNVTAQGVTPITPNMQLPTVHTWSDPQSQIFTITNASVLTYNLTNSMQGMNQDMLIVTHNGKRLRPSETIEHYADGSISYELPTRGGYSQGLISDNDIRVYLNNVLQEQNVDYTVPPWDGSTLRTIEFVNNPTLGERVVIAVSTRAQYTVVAGEITFRSGVGFVIQNGDVINITSWNDTSEQFLLTLVWQGPGSTGTVIAEEGFDSVPFDIGTVLNGPGTFDYSSGTVVLLNNFSTSRVPPQSPERMWVYYNGNRLIFGVGFGMETIDGIVYITLPFTISTTDVVSATLCTERVVPNAMAFRIFQDMRGVQAVYRMTFNTTTQLASAVGANDDIIYVDNASNLFEPVISSNIWGVVTIGAERIMYRYRDTTNNTISGLLRGTAGTSAQDHPVDELVYDLGLGNLLPEEFQDYVVATTVIANGSTSVFTAPNINLTLVDSTIVADESLRVYVGGRQLLPTEYTIDIENPATVTLFITPPAGVEVTLSVLRCQNWYRPGLDTPSDGVPLQLTDTPQAKFLRGD